MPKAQIIKTLIEGSGLTVAEIARRTNLSRQTIHNYIVNDSGKLEALRDISVACGKEPNYLLDKMGEEMEDSSVINDVEETYKIQSKGSLNLDDLYNENIKLSRELLSLQRKYIELHEEYLNYRKSSDSK